MRKKIMTKYEVRVTQIYRDYYHIEAKDEDEAVDRSGYNYDPDEDWAIKTYENGLVIENCHWAETTCEDD